MATWVLAGDVGGTKTDLALYRVDGVESVTLVREASFPSCDYSGLEAIAHEFLKEHDGEVLEAAFGIAGPVIEEKVQVTNLPWKVEAESLAAEIGCQGVRLMNDLETTAYGALFLAPDELVTLNEGIPRRTHRAVIAAGTGLGQAILFWDGQRYRPTATEGGHSAFAPRNERELGLLRYLLGQYERVSYERVLSGPGLSNIFHYLRLELNTPVAPDVLERMKIEDPNAIIGKAALQGTCRTCEEAVEMFVSLYGAQAAALTLTTMALGGLYVGGGIVTKLLPKVKAGGFMEAFVDVGRFEPLMRETPVHVILNPKTALLGAAEAALDLALEHRAIQATR